jgi:hypothetical protein
MRSPSTQRGDGHELGARDSEDELVALVKGEVELRLFGPAGGERREDGRRVLERGLRVLLVLLLFLLVLLVLEVGVVVRRAEELVRDDDVRQLENGPALGVGEVLAELLMCK